MSTKALSRIWPLAFAVATAVIAFEATMARGQIEWSEEPDLVFDTPATLSTNNVRQANSNSASDPANRPGKFNLFQFGGTTTTNETRTAIPGTEPKAAEKRKSAPPSAKKPVLTTQNPQRVVPANPAVPTASNAPVTSPSPTNPGPTPPAYLPSTNASSPSHSAAPALASPNPSRRVTTVANYEPTDVVDRDGSDLANARRPRRMPMPVVVTNPNEQGGPPGVRGILFGLNGMTATERLFQLQTHMSDLQRENDELRQNSSGMMSRLKESQDQLLAGAREIQLARKELAAARGDLDRLRNDLQSLREKVRLTEKEHAAVLQTIGPILQQLLESDDLSALPPHPVERD